MVRLAVNCQKAIRLVFTYRTGLPDRYDITDVCFTGLIVGLKTSRLPDPLLIEGMSDNVFHRDNDSFLHLVAHDPTGLRLDLTRHLYLLFPFGQESKDPGYLSLCVPQAGRIFCLPGRETKPNADQVVLSILQTQVQGRRIELS
jgi:hypothetical protein